MIDFRKTNFGIGFIEVMTATVVISIACIGLMMGVVHARSELHSLEMKERATEELLNYMEVSLYVKLAKHVSLQPFVQETDPFKFDI